MLKTKQTVMAAMMSGALFCFAGQAMASELCTAPESQWQSKEALKTKLEEQGWSVRNIKVEDGCYEAYAKDQDGNRIEAYFDPATLVMVAGKSDD